MGNGRPWTTERNLPLKSAMAVDIILAYLALGSPVGVYLLLQSEKSKPTLSAVGKAFVGFVLWPIFLGILLYKRKPVLITASTFDTRNTSDSRITRNASSLRSAVEGHFERSEDRRFALRKELFDAIDRFVGLRLASHENFTMQQTNAEIFTVSGHPNPGLASMCLARRNARRVAIHAQRSANDLRETLRLRAPEVARSALADELFADRTVVELQQATAGHNAVIISGSSYGNENAS